MNKFGNAHHFRSVGQGFFDPVFQRLDVVIGLCLDHLDLDGLGRRKPGHQGIERCAGLCRKRWNLGKMRLGRQRLEPADFNFQPTANQAIFGKLRTQRINPDSITAIQRRQRNNGFKRHFGHLVFLYSCHFCQNIRQRPGAKRICRRSNGAVPVPFYLST